jgi:hypothetical protein
LLRQIDNCFISHEIFIGSALQPNPLQHVKEG